MSEYLISQFIDDEMDLDEKIVFVETVNTNQRFAEETVALLEQEKLLRDIPVQAMTAEMPTQKPSFSLHALLRRLWQPMAGFATAMFIVVMSWQLIPQQSAPVSLQREYRFVLYLPQAGQTQIMGTFTDWSPMPMHKIGTTGYWTLTLKVPPGEHRYSYLIEDGSKIADPSVTYREQDDFGGENSVIVVGGGDDPIS